MLGSPCSPCCNQCKPLRIPERVEIDVEGIEEVVQPQRFGSTHFYIADRYPNGLPNFNSGYAFTATFWQPEFVSGTYSLSPPRKLVDGSPGSFASNFTNQFSFSNDFFTCDVTVKDNRGFHVAVDATYMHLNFERWNARRGFGDGPPAPTLSQFKQRIVPGPYVIGDGVLYLPGHDFGLGPFRYPDDVIFGGSFAAVGGDGLPRRDFSRFDTTVECNIETRVASVTRVTQDFSVSLPIPSTVFPINGGVGDFTGVEGPFNNPKSLRITRAYIGPGNDQFGQGVYPEIRSELRKRIRITDVRGYDANNTLIPLYDLVPPP
jgi:hypothetical protein